MQKTTKSKSNFVSKILIITMCMLAFMGVGMAFRNYFLSKPVPGTHNQQMQEFEQKLATMKDDFETAYKAAPTDTQLINDTQIKAAYMLTRTAAISLQKGQDIAIAKMLLQLAYDHLVPLTGAKVEHARKIIQADQEKLNAIPAPDLMTLQEKLAILDKLVNVMPAQGGHANIVKDQPNTHAKEGGKDNWSKSVSTVVADLRNVVKVRKKDNHVVSVSEVDIARAQFKLIIEQIRWAAFYNNAEVYVKSIQNAQTLLPQIFDMQSASAQEFANILQDLQNIKLYTEIPTIENSVNALQAILVR